MREGRVRKIVRSFPCQSTSHHFDVAYRTGKIELELVPQGNLAARIQAADAGLCAIFTPTGYGTLLADNKAPEGALPCDAPRRRPGTAPAKTRSDAGGTAGRILLS